MYRLEKKTTARLDKFHRRLFGNTDRGEIVCVNRFNNCVFRRAPLV